MGIDDDIDRLYALPLEEFTAARDELARKLGADKESDTARKVKALRKPTVPAWSLNQLARRHGDDVRALLDVTARIKEAGSAEEWRELSAERKRLAGALSATAQAILEDAGRPASPAHADRISQALMGAVGDEEGHALLEGRLSREPAPTGFAGLTTPPPGVAAPSRPAGGTPGARRAEELAREAEAAAVEAGRLRREAESAERAWRRAEHDADAAERHAQRLRARADRALDDLR